MSDIKPIDAQRMTDIELETALSKERALLRRLEDIGSASFTVIAAERNVEVLKLEKERRDGRS